MTLKPLVHQDTWFLRVTPPAADAAISSGPLVRWERRKRPANPPNPPRAGTTMAFHKGRGIMFGGVYDTEASEEGIESEFYDTLHTWNTDRNRFFQMSLRRPRAPGKKQQASQTQKSKNRSKADEEELLRNLALVTKGNGTKTENDDIDMDAPPEKDEESEEKQSLPVRFEMPHKRFNSQLAVQDDTLFIFGGTYERGDQEFTFNDMYSIDLGKLDGVKEIFYNEPVNWNEAMEPESDDEDESDESDEAEEEDLEMASVDAPSTVPTEITEPSHVEPEAEQEAEIPSKDDSRPHPRPFESLREFYNRTSTYWQDILISKIREQGSNVEKSVKELRKEAFDFAEEKWWDCREEITALEDEQEAAGIGEVVSIADRAQGASVGRRR